MRTLTPMSTTTGGRLSSLTPLHPWKGLVGGQAQDFAQRLQATTQGNSENYPQVWLSFLEQQQAEQITKIEQTNLTQVALRVLLQLSEHQGDHHSHTELQQSQLLRSLNHYVTVLERQGASQSQLLRELQTTLLQERSRVSQVDTQTHLQETNTLSTHSTTQETTKEYSRELVPGEGESLTAQPPHILVQESQQLHTTTEEHLHQLIQTLHLQLHQTEQQLVQQKQELQIINQQMTVAQPRQAKAFRPILQQLPPLGPRQQEKSPSLAERAITTTSRRAEQRSFATHKNQLLEVLRQMEEPETENIWHSLMESSQITLRQQTFLEEHSHLDPREQLEQLVLQSNQRDYLRILTALKGNYQPQRPIAQADQLPQKHQATAQNPAQFSTTAQGQPTPPNQVFVPAEEPTQQSQAESQPQEQSLLAQDSRALVALEQHLSQMGDVQRTALLEGLWALPTAFVAQEQPAFHQLEETNLFYISSSQGDKAPQTEKTERPTPATQPSVNAQPIIKPTTPASRPETAGRQEIQSQQGTNPLAPQPSTQPDTQEPAQSTRSQTQSHGEGEKLAQEYQPPQEDSSQHPQPTANPSPALENLLYTPVEPAAETYVQRENHQEVSTWSETEVETNLYQPPASQAQPEDVQRQAQVAQLVQVISQVGNVSQLLKLWQETPSYRHLETERLVLQRLSQYSASHRQNRGTAVGDLLTGLSEGEGKILLHHLQASGAVPAWMPEGKALRTLRKVLERKNKDAINIDLVQGYVDKHPAQKPSALAGIAQIQAQAEETAKAKAKIQAQIQAEAQEKAAQREKLQAELAQQQEKLRQVQQTTTSEQAWGNLLTHPDLELDQTTPLEGSQTLLDLTHLAPGSALREIPETSSAVQKAIQIDQLPQAVQSFLKMLDSSQSLPTVHRRQGERGQSSQTIQPIQQTMTLSQPIDQHQQARIQRAQQTAKQLQVAQEKASAREAQLPAFSMTAPPQINAVTRKEPPGNTLKTRSAKADIKSVNETVNQFTTEKSVEQSQELPTPEQWEQLSLASAPTLQRQNEVNQNDLSVTTKKQAKASQAKQETIQLLTSQVLALTKGQKQLRDEQQREQALSPSLARMATAHSWQEGQEEVPLQHLSPKHSRQGTEMAMLEGLIQASQQMATALAQQGQAQQGSIPQSVLADTTPPALKQALSRAKRQNILYRQHQQTGESGSARKGSRNRPSAYDQVANLQYVSSQGTIQGLSSPSPGGGRGKVAVEDLPSTQELMEAPLPSLALAQAQSRRAMDSVAHEATQRAVEMISRNPQHRRQPSPQQSSPWQDSQTELQLNRSQARGRGEEVTQEVMRSTVKKEVEAQVTGKLPPIDYSTARNQAEVLAKQEKNIAALQQAMKAQEATLQTILNPQEQPPDPGQVQKLARAVMREMDGQIRLERQRRGLI